MNCFLQENRIFKSMSHNAKRDYVILNILTSLVFVILAFALFETVYFICNILGSIVCRAPYQSLEELKRTLPLIVGCFAGIYVLAMLCKLTFGLEGTNKNKILFSTSIVMLVVGLFILIYFSIGLSNGLYVNPVGKNIAHKRIFVSLIISCILYFLLGGASLIISLKYKGFAGEIPYRSKNYKTFVKVLRGIATTGLVIGSGYSLSALIHATYTVDLTNNIDYSHNASFYVTCLIFVFLTCLLMVVTYYFIYLPLKEEHKLKFQFISSIIFTSVNIVIFVLYEVAHGLFPNAPIVSCYAILPIDFAATMNVFGKIYGIMILFPPIIALVIAIIKIKNQKSSSIK